VSSVNQILLSNVSSNHTECTSNQTQWQHRHEEKRNHESFNMISVSLSNVKRWSFEPEIGFFLSQVAVLSCLDDASLFNPSDQMEWVEEIRHWWGENIEKHNPPSIITETLFRPNFISQILTMNNPINEHNNDGSIQKLSLTKKLKLSLYKMNLQKQFF
jgi:hypothetical protein